MPGPQSAVGRNPTALFHLVREFPLLVQRASAARILRRLGRAYPVFPTVIVSAGRLPLARIRVHRRPGLPGWRAQKASVTLSFRRPCGRENGRQFSYKQNAEEGVRLDEKRGTMDRGTRGSWRRSCGVGDARVCVGAHEPSCGRHAHSRAVCRHDGAHGGCVAIRFLVHVRMNGRFFDPARPACGAEPGRAGRPSDDRCVRIDRVSRNVAFLRFVHPDDIAAAHRGGRTAVSACARGIAATGWRRGVSRENERRRGTAR